MFRALVVIAGSCLASFAQDRSQKEVKMVQWTGWFSDFTCASSRAADGIFGATNPECARACIRKGASGVFISEQAKGVFTVTGYPQLPDDLGYHIEIQARLDQSGRSLEIQSVKKLAQEGAACGRPKKSTAKQ